MTSTNIKLPPRISVSQIQTFNRCRFKYWLKYVKKFKVSRQSPGQVRGAILHSAYDAFLFNGRQDEAAWNAVEIAKNEYLEKGSDASMIAKVHDELVGTLNAYLPYAKKHDDFNVVLPYRGQKQCETEGEVMLELPDGTFKPLFFKIDAMILKNDQLMMMEHKFYKTLSMGKLEHDFQIGVYNAAWNKLFPAYGLNGVLYNVVGVKPRKADGAIAVREYHYRGPMELTRVLSNVSSQAFEIKRAAESEHQVWPLNPKDDCSWDCDFVSQCMQLRTGTKLSELTNSGQLTATIYPDMESEEPQPDRVFEPTQIG